ncbi:MAG: hypothetical protein LC804_24270 [Acidobacteria bacterium]|nr:hypothetical protein [Acidobacteriota bacterium]
MKPTLSPIGRARLMVTALVVVMVTAFFPASQPARPRLPPKGEGDAYLHLATIERIRAGDRYYDAVGEELRRGRYPATHVFNWRTPAHFVAVATLSVPVARVILKVLAFIALGLTMLALARESRAVLVIGAIAQLGAVATAFRPMAVGVSEVWAGVFIALSLCAYVKRWWTAAAVLGIAAVFTRELAAPYCVACAVLAMPAHRRREASVWIAGGLAYAVYFAIHLSQVQAHQLPTDLSHTESWLRWNGLEFIIATLKVNGWIGLAPRWVAVLYMVLALAAATLPRAPRQVVVPLLTYFVLFAFAGQPFNNYWGWVTAPIWAFAAAYGVEGVHLLILAALRPQFQPPRHV